MAEIKLGQICATCKYSKFNCAGSYGKKMHGWCDLNEKRIYRSTTCNLYNVSTRGEQCARTIVKQQEKEHPLVVMFHEVMNGVPTETVQPQKQEDDYRAGITCSYCINVENCNGRCND